MNTLTVTDVCRLIFGIQSYFIWDEDDPRGFDEVPIDAQLEIVPEKWDDLENTLFTAQLKCTGGGCELNWSSDPFPTIEEAIVDLGKIFNEGKFIRDELNSGHEFIVGPESDIPEPDDLY